MVRITSKAAGGGGCQGDHCPAVWETDDPSWTAIQGNRPEAGSLAAAGEIPAGEDMVLVPTELLRDWGARSR
jgi:hypothetical protein